MSASRSVAVSFAASAPMRAEIATALAPLASVVYLSELQGPERASALSAADALLAWSIADELDANELRALDSVAFVQLLSAGVNRVPFELIPVEVQVASNAGAWAGPMAEQVLGMALALAKRLAPNHAALMAGIFDQRTPTKELRCSVVAILGFGGIGRASAKLFRALGARIYAVSRTQATGNEAELYATLEQLDSVLQAADVLVISLPLTRETRGLIGARELALMKPEAILINVARAEIVDEDALYDRLRDTPSFSAGLDVWWHEPERDEAFKTQRPFFELSNLIGSPHNSALTAGAIARATRQAADNVARYLRGEHVEHLVDRSDYVAEA